MSGEFDFRALLLKIQDRLSDNDRLRFLFLLGEDVPRYVRDDPPLIGALRALESLFDKAIINAQDCDYLIKAFKTIGCNDAAKRLQVVPNIPTNARWAQNGTTVAGGPGPGSAADRLFYPYGLSIDDDQTMVIADSWNQRIMQWKMGDKIGQVVAGGHDNGSRLNQLNYPTDVLIDNETDRLIICDRDNSRVVQWSRSSGTIQGEILMDNIACWGLTMDAHRCLYVPDWKKHEVRRYEIGEKHGTVVAGGHGQGAALNQLNEPTYIFVDQQQTVYVSDNNNHRVMKWNKGATEGIIVAGVQGYQNALSQMRHPNGLFVDTLDTVYVADTYNHRVMRWPKGAKEGTVIVGGNDKGPRADQFNLPTGLSFDRHGNLYVADRLNSRVQQFTIE
ncbi:unnamed protein product [Rotaria sp. Silwood2]|nr:unnamed protein product [Rotaria sp. Silwood2]CAF3955987.1 unnamed protein product [Rotaria sp. Silwood2]